MKHMHLIIGLCFISLVSCTNKKSPDAPAILNKALLQSYENLDESLKKERKPLYFNGDHISSNCQTYFDMAAKYEIDETIHNQMIKSEYLTCDALKILSSSSGVPAKEISVFNMGEEIISKLDIRSFPSSLFQVADENSNTLKALFPENVSATNNMAELDTDELSFTLEVVAAAKINNNPQPDWIIWLMDESKSGTYRSYQTLIIFDPENQDRLKAVSNP